MPVHCRLQASQFSRQPPFQRGKLFVARGQNAVSHEGCSQVSDRGRGAQAVQEPVGDRLAGGGHGFQGGRRAGVRLQPAQHGGGLAAHQARGDRAEAGGDRAVGAGQEVVEKVGERARGA
ncbi:hypothetical protein GCM10017744_077900 [Streptomyces antimycoticus]